MKEIIKTEKLCKSFSNDGTQQHVIKNLDLEIMENDFTIIMGSSGSGNAIPVKPVQEMSFETWNGRDLLKDVDGEYQAERIAESDISDDAQRAWDERNGVTYYYVSGD